MRSLATVVVVSMALLSSLCVVIPVPADARTLHYHRKHRRPHHHHRHHRAAANDDDGHIALPPAVDVDGDPPAGEPAGSPASVIEDDAAPPPPQRGHDDDRPCPPPPSKAPAGSPRSVQAFSLPKPESSSPVPAKAPSSHSHARSPPAEPQLPSLPPTGAPSSLSAAKPPAFSPAKPPSTKPASTPFHPPRKAPAPSSFSPSKSPSSLPPFLAYPPAYSWANTPPRLAPAKPAMPPPPARSPRLSPTSPPEAEAPLTAPALPPLLSHVKPQPLAKPRQQLGPAKPPVPPPTQTPWLSWAQPPALPPAVSKPLRLGPARPPALPPAVSTPPSATAPAANNGNNVFDVRAFGASGNASCADDDTRAFRAAWKAACSSSSESATLLVPSDGVFTITSTVFAGPCKPGLTFQVDGVLMPPDGPASWPASDSRKQWIVFYKADGITLAGKGTVEGNGEEWWELPCKPHRGPNGSTLPGPCESPALIRFSLSNDVTVRGLRIENSPQFHLKFDVCRRVRVDGLSVSSPAFSPNTDGVHVENSTSVQIVNSIIHNGDDCISIGSGCSGVHIENVTCVHGHGISIGSLGTRNTRACVSNVTVRNARVVDSDNGVRIKTWQGGAGAVAGVDFAGVQMQNVKNCIVIDQYYCLAGAGGCANQSSAVRVAGVAYRDIRGTYSRAPIRLACSDAVACTDITMSGVELIPAVSTTTAQQQQQLADTFCWNAYGLTETPTLPPVYCLQEGRPQSLQDQLMSC